MATISIRCTTASKPEGRARILRSSRDPNRGPLRERPAVVARGGGPNRSQCLSPALARADRTHPGKQARTRLVHDRNRRPRVSGRHGAAEERPVQAPTGWLSKSNRSRLQSLPITGSAGEPRSTSRRWWRFAGIGALWHRRIFGTDSGRRDCAEPGPCLKRPGRAGRGGPGTRCASGRGCGTGPGRTRSS